MDLPVPYLSPMETTDVLKRGSFPEGRLSDDLAGRVREAISAMNDAEFKNFYEKHKESIHTNQQKLATLGAWFSGGEHPLETNSFTSIMTSELEKRQIQGIKTGLYPSAIVEETINHKGERNQVKPDNSMTC